MFKRSKQITIATALVISVSILVAAVIACSFLPIYPDEVAYKIFLERYWLNGGFKQSVTPFCSQGFMYKPPNILMPAAIFWTLPYYLGHSWISYRILPFLAISVIALFLLLEGWRRRSISTILTVTLMCAGPTIYGLIIFRPEVFVLAFTCVALFSFRRMNRHASLALRITWSILLIFGFSIVAFMHPKALYLTPFLVGEFMVLIYLWRHRTGTLMLWLICIVMISTIAIQSAKMHQTQFLHCSEYPSIEASMNRQSINLYNASRSLSNLQQAFNSLIAPNVTKNGFDQLGFKNPSDVGYLPSLPESILVRSADFISKIALLVIFLLALGKIVESLTKLQGLNVFKYFSFATLYFGLTIPYILSLTRHWYDAAGFCGGITIIAVVFLSPYSPRKIRRFIASLSVLTAISSLCVIVTSLIPAFVRGYHGPGITLVTNRAAVDEAVNKLIDRYHIKANDPLIVDDLTYEATKDRTIVVPITYLSLGLQNRHFFRSTLVRLGLEYGISSTAMPHSFWDDAGFEILESIKLPGQDKTISLFTVKDLPD